MLMRLSGHAGPSNRNFLKQPLHDGEEAARADILGPFVHLHRHLGDFLQAVFGEFDGEAFGGQQGLILPDQRAFRFRQDTDQIVFGQGAEFDADRKSPLELGNQIGRLRHMKGPGGDEEDMIRHDRAMFGGDGAAFHDGEQVALHAFSGHIGSHGALAPGDLVDLIQEHNPGLFYLSDGFPRGIIHIDQFLGFFLRQVFERFGDFHEPLLFLALKHAAQHVSEIALEVVKSAHVGNDADRKASFLDFHLHRAFIQFPFPQLQAQFRSRRVVGIVRGLRGRLARAVHEARSEAAAAREDRAIVLRLVVPPCAARTPAVGS